MFDSIIASSHHYYIVFFEAPEIKDVENLMSMISTKKSQSEHITEDKSNFHHLQILSDKRFGAEGVLNRNIQKVKDKNYYWYDLYLGLFKKGRKKIFYVCCPYNGIRKTVIDALNSNGVFPRYFKSSVPKILEKIESNSELIDLEIENELVVSITKYSAQIKEEANSNRINIMGINPLNSRVYEILKGNSQIEISPSSLKMRFKLLKSGAIELSIDRLGNYRFFIRKESQISAMNILPYIFGFLSAAGVLEERSFISNQTLLEDE